MKKLKIAGIVLVLFNFVCDHWNACTICTYEIGKQNK